MSKEVTRATPRKREKPDASTKKIKVTAKTGQPAKVVSKAKSSSSATAKKATAKKATAKKTPSKTGAPAPKKAPSLGDVASGVGSVADGVKSFDLREFCSRFRVPLVVIAVLLVLFVALYGPAKGYYSAWRTNGILLAEHKKETAEGEQLEDDVNALMTEQGIKDEARKKGYVDEGEKIVVVEGLEPEEEPEEAPESDPWYLELGDLVFQYEKEQ